MFSDFPASVFARRLPPKPQTHKSPLDLVSELRRVLLHVPCTEQNLPILEAVDALAAELEAAIRQSNGAVYQAMADLGNVTAENSELRSAAAVLDWFANLLPGERVAVQSTHCVYTREDCDTARTESIRLVAGSATTALPALQALCTDLGDESPTRDTIPASDDSDERTAADIERITGQPWRPCVKCVFHHRDPRLEPCASCHNQDRFVRQVS